MHLAAGNEIRRETIAFARDVHELAFGTGRFAKWRRGQRNVEALRPRMNSRRLLECKPHGLIRILAADLRRGVEESKAHASAAGADVTRLRGVAVGSM